MPSKSDVSKSTPRTRELFIGLVIHPSTKLKASLPKLHQRALCFVLVAVFEHVFSPKDRQNHSEQINKRATMIESHRLYNAFNHLHMQTLCKETWGMCILTLQVGYYAEVCKQYPTCMSTRPRDQKIGGGGSGTGKLGFGFRVWQN